MTSTPTTTKRRSRTNLALDGKCNFLLFAESFRAGMDRHGYSVPEAAQALKVSTSIIYAYERGISRPEGALLTSAEKLLGKLDMSEPTPSQAAKAAASAPKPSLAATSTKGPLAAVPTSPPPRTRPGTKAAAQADAARIARALRVLDLLEELKGLGVPIQAIAA